MPGRCTIACDHCGYLQLRRDTDFDQCGPLTRRERNLWIAKAIQIPANEAYFEKYESGDRSAKFLKDFDATVEHELVHFYGAFFNGNKFNG